MFQRLLASTKWVWCFLVMSSGSTWNPVNGGSVPAPPNTPTTIEAQAKFFQYRHLPTSEDFDQGHRLGSERHFVERHERSRPATGLFSAKVRWGDKKGGYGEHYWDLNHAGHVQDNDNYDYDSGSDDGSYHEDPHDFNDESNEKLQKYEIDEYNPDDTNHYEESGRAKRAHRKVKPQLHKDDNNNTEQEERQPKETRLRKNKEDYKVNEDNDNDEAVTSKPLSIKPRRRLREQNNEEVPSKQIKEKNHIVLIVNQKQKDDQVDTPKQPEPKPFVPYENSEPKPFVPYENSEPKPFVPYDSSEPKRFVPYEGGAGVRQHLRPEFVPSASVPKLFLDQSTGHIIDRTTGQAYVLQPIPHNVHYS